MEKRYHCFWVNPFGMRHEYVAHDDEENMLELVRQNATEDSNVKELCVIWGELLEFEPVTVVKTFRVKQ